MTDLPPTPDPGPAPAPNPRASRRFRRGDGPLGGVAVGIAHLTQLDVTLVRAVLVIGSFFAPALVLLYLAAWVLVPTTADPDPRPFRIEGSTATMVLGAFLIVGAVGSTGISPFYGPDPGNSIIVAAILVGGGIFLLNRSSRDGSSPASGDPARTDPANTDPANRDPAATQPPPPQPWALPIVDHVEPDPPAPSVPITSIALGVALLISCALLALGQLIDGFDVGSGAILGTIVACCGAGLVVSAFVGRAIPLIVVGLVALSLLAAAPAIDRVNTGSIGARDEHPLVLSDLDRRYEVGAGELTLDLTDVLSDAEPGSYPVEVQVGAGTARVLVPDTVDLDVDITSQFGLVSVGDVTHEGIRAELDQTFVAPSGSDEFDERASVTLVLTGEVIFGSIEVRRD